MGSIHMECRSRAVSISTHPPGCAASMPQNFTYDRPGEMHIFHGLIAVKGGIASYTLRWSPRRSRSCSQHRVGDGRRYRHAPGIYTLNGDQTAELMDGRRCTRLSSAPSGLRFSSHLLQRRTHRVTRRPSWCRLAWSRANRPPLPTELAALVSARRWLDSWRRCVMRVF